MTVPQGGHCWNCGQALVALDYGRQDTCRKCGRDTKVCKNCVNYERGAHNDCREPQAERVVDKERSCFCDWFKPRSGSDAAGASRDAMKAAAEALFKKKP